MKIVWGPRAGIILKQKSNMSFVFAAAWAAKQLQKHVL
jgi:hypothetical protein